MLVFFTLALLGSSTPCVAVVTSEYESLEDMQRAIDLTPPPWDLKRFLQSLPPLGRPLRCAAPCIGIDGCGAAMQIMGLAPCEMVNVYDLEEGYRQTLFNHLLELGMKSVNIRLNLGEQAGDLLRANLADLELPVDMLVCGPPCPPWAGQGNHHSCRDERAKVFMAIIEWIVFLASCGGLLCCVVENVTGMLCSYGGIEPAMDKFIRILREHVPFFDWCVDTLKLVNYTCPQTRVRVFLRGIRKTVIAFVPKPLPPFGKRKLRDALAKLPHTPRHCFSTQQQDNIKVFEAKIRSLVQAGRLYMEDLCVVPPDRQDGLGYPQKMTVNNCPTFTCHNFDLLVLSVHDVVHDVPDASREFFRILSPPERLTLQGFPAKMAATLGKTLTYKASGNAYPPPLMLACLYPMMAAIGSSSINLQLWPPSDLPKLLPDPQLVRLRRLLLARGRIVNRNKFAAAKHKAALSKKRKSSSDSD